MCLLSGPWRRTQCQFLVSPFCQSGQRLWLLFSGSLKKTKWIKDLKADLSCNGAPPSFFRGLRISQVPLTYVYEPVSSSANEAYAKVLIEVSPSWAGPMISTWLFHSLLPLIWCLEQRCWQTPPQYSICINAAKKTLFSNLEDHLGVVYCVH